MLDIIFRVLSYCSIRCLFRLSKYLAFIASHIQNQPSTLTRQNIKLCFPKLNNSQQLQLVNNSLHHSSCTFIELAALWQQPVDKILNTIKTKQIDDIFFDRGKSKIIIAPHFGSWELLNLWLANEGPLFSLYKPARSASADQYMLKNRTRNNAVLVPANTTGLRQLLVGLKNNASCMILPDQRPAENTAQVKATFYNQPAATSLLIKRLASKVDCNIFIASVTRNLTSAEYHLIIRSLSRSEFLTDDLNSADYLNKSIEDLISQNICQYQWAYRRFPRQVYENL